ncbi:hypothetical protein H0G86_001776 [Trichoderma simmonsii]|uniref:Uncharacterized protein n=1 Tax=Trichoderma simmonsii TaxID=1491479 RepID=A0A8G0L290_9HYPO|nr:hypothetical protein H0G86_001776 [Trichoderma simmonsii]
MQEASLGRWAYSPLAKDAVHIRVRQENAGVEAGRPIVRLSMYYLLVVCWCPCCIRYWQQHTMLVPAEVIYTCQRSTEFTRTGMRETGKDSTLSSGLDFANSLKSLFVLLAGFWTPPSPRVGRPPTAGLLNSTTLFMDYLLTCKAPMQQISNDES